jgi:hypothetical protein
MTDDNVSGSGSGTGGSAGAGADGTKNKAAKMSMDQAYAEIENYKRVVGEKDSLISDLTKQLDEANKVLDGQERGRLIGEILPRVHDSITAADLAGKSTEELKSMRATLDVAMPPKVNSVRFGVHAADLSDREKGLTVGDMSVVTAAKRKGAA